MKQYIITQFVTLCVFILAFTIYACTKTVYVPTETIRTVTKTERDTTVLVKLDTQFVYKQTKDTLVQAETKYAQAKAMYVSGLLSLELANKKIAIPVDTKYIYVTQVDSISKPYPVEKIVKERYVPWYTKWLAYIGGGSLLLFGFTIIKRFKWIG